MPASADRLRAPDSALRRIARNSGWLLGEGASRLAVGLFVGGWTARYLGPEQFGALNYALALAAMAGVVANLGLDSIVVRDLARNPAGASETLGSAFALKASGSLLAFGCCVGAAALLGEGGGRSVALVAVASLVLLVQAFNTYDLWLQSRLQARLAVLARHAAFLLLAAVKVALILERAPLIAFAWTLLAESGLAALGLALAYRRQTGHAARWRPRVARMRQLLRQCWPLLLSAAAIVLYLRIGQVLLAQFAGAAALGTYTAAITLSEVWYAVPAAVVASAAPLLAQSRDSDPAAYRRQLVALLRWLAAASCGFALTASWLAAPLVRVVFGASYGEAAAVLAVHAWSGVFVALGAASGQYLVQENLTLVALQRTVAGALTSVALNLLWIPRYGAVGAAWAAVAAHAVAATFLFQTRDSRACLRLMARALWPSPGRHA